MALDHAMTYINTKKKSNKKLFFRPPTQKTYYKESSMTHVLNWANLNTVQKTSKCRQNFLKSLAFTSTSKIVCFLSVKMKIA